MVNLGKITATSGVGRLTSTAADLDASRHAAVVHSAEPLLMLLLFGLLTWCIRSELQLLLLLGSLQMSCTIQKELLLLVLSGLFRGAPALRGCCYWCWAFCCCFISLTSRRCCKCWVACCCSAVAPRSCYCWCFSIYCRAGQAPSRCSCK